MNKLTLLPVFCAFLMGCATNERSVEETSEKPIQYVDLTKEGKQETLDEYWVLDSRLSPQYPVSAAKKGISGCVELTVGINEQGKASGYKVTKSYPEGLFDKSAAASMNGWSWLPAETNPQRQPVLTEIQLDFMVEGGSNKAEAEKHCGYAHSY